MNTFKKFAFVALTVAAVFSGKQSFAAASENPYELVTTSFPRPWYKGFVSSVTVERQDRLTGNPAPVSTAHTVTVRNRGGGIFGGTKTKTMAAGSASVTFDDLTLSAAGPAELDFEISDEAAESANKSFAVYFPYRLFFNQVPNSVVAPTSFDVQVVVVDIRTGVPVAPHPAMPIALKTNGKGILNGNTIVTTSGSTATFHGLSYSGLENATLSAIAHFVAPATSTHIDFDQPKVAIAGTSPNPPLVNGSFSMQLAFTSALHAGIPVAVTNLPLTLSKVSGSGTLTGAGNYVVSGTNFVIPGLSYNAFDTLTAKVTTPYGNDQEAIPVEVSMTGPTSTIFCTPNFPVPAQTYTFRDGLNNPFPVTGLVSWAVKQGVAVIQSGFAPIANQSTVVIVPSALAAGSYQLTVELVGHPTASNSTAIETLTDYPGPVAILRSGRIGSPYTETTSDYITGSVTNYLVGEGSLPAGINLDPVTGNLSGQPTANGTTKFLLIAKVGTAYKPIRCTLSVFTAEESEYVPGQNFGLTGATPPYTASQQNTTVSSLDNTFDNNFPSFQVRIHYPTQLASIDGPLPLLVYQHGRGFDHTEYNDILSRTAKWGFICLSSGDYYSFFGNTQPGYSGPQPYEASPSYAEAGMESASGTQEALLRYMIIRNRTVGDLFYGKIDESRLFVAGHSRGGGSTHASQSRGFLFTAAANPPQIPATEKFGIAGYIGLMAYDLWSFIKCQPPNIPLVPGGIGATPYNIPKVLRQIPGMIFAAENDGDLTYPICDQLIERRSTQTSFLTIWGANHNQTGDAHPNDGSPAISGVTQRNIIVQWMTAFMLRIGYDRLDLENHLFGDEYTQSTQGGHVYERDLSSQILVYDAQNGNAALNNLNQPNTTSGTGITATLTNPYPTSGQLANANPRSVRLTFTTTGIGKFWQTGLGTLDVSKTKQFIFEIRQSGTQGFNWISLNVTLTDSSNESSTVVVYDHTATPDVSEYLPIYPIPGFTSARPLNRFMQVEIPLSKFTGINLNSLANARFDINNGNTTNNLMLDDIRFE